MGRVKAWDAKGSGLLHRFVVLDIDDVVAQIAEAQIGNQSGIEDVIGADGRLSSALVEFPP